MALGILVNTGLGYDLSLNQNNSSHEPMLIYRELEPPE